MFTNNKIANAVRLALVAGITISTPVTFAADSVAKEQVERIQVTGSKIKRLGELSPTPITVLTGDSLVKAGITNVAELLSQIPSSTVGLSPETTNNNVFANGLSNTDLRGLGTSRTLVLVNGRRFVAGAPGSSAVDLNNIPTSMISRIEITTGGSSAVYGSDAMAGVVNIITKKSFDGFNLDFSTTKPRQSGGESSYVSLTFGNESEKSSYIANISFTDGKQLRGDQRDFIRNGVIRIDHPDNVDDTDGIPRKIIWDKEGATALKFYSPTGDFFTDDGHFIFANDGSVRPFETGEIFPKSKTPGSRNTNYFIGDGDGYHFLKHKYVRTPLSRLNINSNFNYDFNELHSMAFELTYSKTHAYGESSPAFHRLTGRTDNAFFSADTKKFFADRDMDEFTAYMTTDILGNRKYDQKRQLFQAVISFTGELSDTWTYDAYIQKGHVQANTTWYGEMFTKNLTEAIDAVEFDGEIVCADRNDDGEVVGGITGCSPINLWGKNLASAESLDYVSTDATRNATIQQTTFSASANGDIYELEAGVISAAFTAEHRKEESSTLPDPAMRKGLIFNNQSEALSGEFDVTELAAEFLVPLVSDTFFADEITLETAYRYMDYSSTGTDNAWKIGLNYALNDEIRFRFNRSKSVRAPNIDELYSPKAEDFNSFNDPCEQGQIDNAGEYKDNILRNCRAQGIPEGWAPSEDWKRTNHSGFSLGNLDLKNETSYDMTIGFIYTPSFIEDLSITVDYWKFDLKDMITTPSAKTVINGCYEFSSTDNPYCPLIQRNASTFEIDSYFLKPVNAASNNIAGTDIEINYSLDSGFGLFDIKLLATYTEKRESNNTGKVEDQRSTAGEIHRPRWKARMITNYVYDDLSVALITSYRHHSVLDNDWIAEDSNYNDVPSYIKWDLTAKYHVTENLVVRGGIINLFDVAPPRIPGYYDDGEFFDLNGQTFTLGMNLSF